MKKIKYIFTALIVGGMLSFGTVGSVMAQDRDNTVAEANDDDDDFDFGWVGLIGLAGLLGLKKKDRVDTNYTRPTTPRV